MKYLKRAGWALYFLFYLNLSSNGIISLLDTNAKTRNFYYALMAFHHANAIWYLLALAAVLLSVISLWPLYVRAFALRRSAGQFFRVIFVLKILTDLCGHRYETLTFQAIWRENHLAAVLAMTALLLVQFPFYKALFEHGWSQTTK